MAFGRTILRSIEMDGAAALVAMQQGKIVRGIDGLYLTNVQRDNSHR